MPFAAGAAWAALLFLIPRGYAIDDTYIHLQYARNLAGGEGLRFSAGTPPVYACSSPAWAFLLSLPFHAGLGGPVAARLLSSISAGAAAVLAWAAAGRIAGNKGGSVPAAAMIFCMADPWIIRWGASGMEASLAAAVAAAWLLTMLSRSVRPSASGALAGLAFLVRPELAILGPLGLLRGEYRTSLRRTALLILPWVAAVSAWSLFALSYFGRAVPEAVSAKASTVPILSYLASELPRLAGSLAVSCGPLAAAAVIRSVVRGKGYPPEGSGRRRTGISLAVLPAVILSVMLLAGGAPATTRYLVPVMPVLFAGLASAAFGPGPVPRRGAGAASVLTLSLQIWLSASVVWPHMAVAAANMEIYREVASGLDSLTPPGSLVAVQEIGVFGYEGHRGLLDLGGLVTPGARSGFPGLDADAMASVAYLREHGATHILDPHGAVARLAGSEDRLGVAFEPLGSWVFPGGTSLSGGETYTRILYRLDWR